LIDATRKGKYPPVGLPKKKYMERALELWREMKMPELQLKTPWYGYPLDLWTADDDALAEAVAGGGYFPSGKKIERTVSRWRREKPVTKLGCAKRVFQSSRGTGWMTLLNCRESPGREPADREPIFSSRAWKDSPACMLVKSLPAGP